MPIKDFDRYKLQDNTVSIFLFHGVVKKNVHHVRNYLRKHIEADYFADLLSYWNQTGTAISLDEFVHYQKVGSSLPPRPFIVTFDDGFENNFSVAAPILQDAKVPAIFYVTTGWIEQNIMGWIDRIEYAFEHCNNGKLLFPWSSETRTFSTTTEKIRLLDEVRAYVKADPHLNPQQFADSVFDQLHLPQVNSSEDPLDKKMSWDQVKKLAHTAQFVVGAHTHNHAILSFVPPRLLYTEIGDSINFLSARVEKQIQHFAYPDGQSHHYNERVIMELKNHGIVCCPTAIYGTNLPTEDLFHLKRIFVS